MPPKFVTTRTGLKYTPPVDVSFGVHSLRLMEVLAPTEARIADVKLQAARKGWWVYVEGSRNDGFIGIVFAQDLEPSVDDYIH